MPAKCHGNVRILNLNVVNLNVDNNKAKKAKRKTFHFGVAFSDKGEKGSKEVMSSENIDAYIVKPKAKETKYKDVSDHNT